MLQMLYISGLRAPISEIEAPSGLVELGAAQNNNPTFPRRYGLPIFLAIHLYQLKSLWRRLHRSQASTHYTWDHPAFV